MNPDLTDLRQLFSYEPDTGLVRWRVSLNRRIKVGSVAGSLMKSGAATGYVFVMFRGRRHGAHQIAWALMTGEWPTLIDHWNCDRADNRWGNLRNVNHSVNAHNAKLRSNNRSGVKNVYLTKWGWRVRQKMAGVYIFNKKFTVFEDAVAAAADLSAF
jgi:hypothetical protein